MKRASVVLFVVIQLICCIFGIHALYRAGHHMMAYGAAFAIYMAIRVWLDQCWDRVYAFNMALVGLIVVILSGYWMYQLKGSFSATPVGFVWILSSGFVLMVGGSAIFSRTKELPPLPDLSMFFTIWRR